MSRYDLTDFEWRVIEPLLPNKPGGVPRVDDRRLLQSLRALAKAGVWDRMIDAISQQARNRVLIATPAKAVAHNHSRMDTGFRRYDDRDTESATNEIPPKKKNPGSPETSGVFPVTITLSDQNAAVSETMIAASVILLIDGSPPLTSVST